MRGFARRLLKLCISFVGVVLLGWLLAPVVLDRHYYSGPKSDHYDGQHFFNPDVNDYAGAPRPKSRGAFATMLGLFTGWGRPAWPDSVPVTPTKPAARIEGARLIVTWVGHATVLVQTEGLNILTDPIWAQTAGPLGFGPARVAQPGIRFEDLPKIDAVLVSHNHYDHLDVETLQRLQERDHPRIFTALGNDNLLAREGVHAEAMDWRQQAQLTPDVSIISTRNHHWGSRWMVDAKRALWTAFIIKTPHGNIFFAGDTGAGDMKWPVEAASYGRIRLALIPIGAFRFVPGQMANDSHIGPVDAVEVFERLNAQQAIAIHWGTFHLSAEHYDTPPKMLAEVMKCHGLDTARFNAADFGIPTEVAALSKRLPTHKKPDAFENCIQSAPVTSLL